MDEIILKKKGWPEVTIELVKTCGVSLTAEVEAGLKCKIWFLDAKGRPRERSAGSANRAVCAVSWGVGGAPQTRTDPVLFLQSRRGLLLFTWVFSS